MFRMILGIVLGYAAWSLLWLGGNRFLFAGAAAEAQEGAYLGDTRQLVGLLGLSIFCSLVAGALTAVLARKRRSQGVGVLAGILLATGLGVQVGVWSQMPVWYHVAFLALLIPGCLGGMRLAPGRKGA